LFFRRRLADPAETGGSGADAAGASAEGSRPLIRVEGITKRFGALTAVDDLTLEIRDGEFFCLLGPSGCGKSTLLRLLAGFEEPDQGRVLLDGRDITTEPAHRRPLNMMFQSYALFPHLTVAGNVAYGLKRAGMSKADTARRVDEMLQLVRLPDLGERYPAHISGGQRQRVALARALARNPRVLLLDEPLGALDRRLREETQAELKNLQHKLGTTFVMVTHDQDEAMSMADRIGVMNRGRMAQLGPPQELYERPRSRFVAMFLGDVNLADGRVVAVEAGEMRVATAWSDTPLTVLRTGTGPVPGASCTVAIRPETLAIVPEGAKASGQNTLTGRIVGESYLGGQTILRVEVAPGQVLRVARPNARATVGGVAAQAVHLAFAPDAAVLLP
jgi:putrescine transport system ATP-binding protein